MRLSSNEETRDESDEHECDDEDEADEADEDEADEDGCSEDDHDVSMVSNQESSSAVLKLTAWIAAWHRSQPPLQ